VAGHCLPSCFIQGEEFVGKLSNYQLLKKHSGSWSWSENDRKQNMKKALQ
jgi:hypothetical protein